MLSHSVYKNENTSKWVTFIHGAGGSSSIWFQQFRAFKNEFNILLIDLSGHGKSKSRFSENSKEGYTFELISGDIVEVLNSLSIKKSHFIGVSLGTIIVRDIADRFPNLVESLVLAGAILSEDVMPGVVVLSTGAWFDPNYNLNTEVHGNPNVLTNDVGTSSLGQGPTSHTTLIEIKKASKEEIADVMIFNSLSFKENT